MKFIPLAFSLAVSALTGLGAAPAQAQDVPLLQRYYVGFGLGLSTLNDSTADTATGLASALGGTASGTQDTSGSSTRLFGGYHLNQTVSIELGFYQSSAISQRMSGVAGNGLGYSGSASLTSSGLDYSVLLRPGRTLNGNGVFFRLGGHYLTVNGNTTLTGTSTVSVNSNLSGNGMLWGAGYDMPIQENLSARLEYLGIKNIAGKVGTSDNFSLSILSKF